MSAIALPEATVSAAAIFYLAKGVYELARAKTNGKHNALRDDRSTALVVTSFDRIMTILHGHDALFARQAEILVAVAGTLKRMEEQHTAEAIATATAAAVREAMQAGRESGDR